MAPAQAITDFGALLQTLVDAGVDFILVGGLAASAHGSARFTTDLDVVYSRTPANLKKLVDCLAPLQPYLRGAPPGLPFSWDERTLKMGLNFTLTTSAGWIDLLGEIVGAGNYETILPKTEMVRLFDRDFRCITLEGLIRAKRAAGRPKDFEAIAELEALLEEKQSR